MSAISKVKEPLLESFDHMTADRVPDEFTVGLAAMAKQDYVGAARHFEKSLSRSTSHTKTYVNLIYCLRKSGQIEKAIRMAETGSNEHPDSSEIYYGLGNCWFEIRKFHEALAAFQRAKALNPTSAYILCNVGVSLQKLGRIDEAIATLRSAIKIDPTLTILHDKLGSILAKNGDVPSGLRSLSRAMTFNDTPSQASGIHTRYLFWRNYNPRNDRRALYTEARFWNELHAKSLSTKTCTHRNTVSDNRVINVGFVSPDLCAHSVSFFILPLLQHLDRNQIQTTCYSDTKKPDHVTDEIKKASHQWRDVRTESDQQFCETVQSDGIDILIDLTGHTSNNRLLAFARKPAPIQITWCGYPATTGLAAMDYRLTDAYVDPGAMAASTHSERLLYLDSGFLCYQPLAETPPIKTSAVPDEKGIVFGSFNNLGKVTDEVIVLWAKILKAVPNSHLLMKRRELKSEFSRRLFTSRLLEHGITSQQFSFSTSQSSIQNHLDKYNEVDIALDTFPYNGTTTTFEALWMGTPVIALLGETHAARVSADILSRMNLKELIGQDKSDYIGKACALASDRVRLKQLTTNLRPMLKDSTWCDADNFTKEFNHAIQRVWTDWCKNQNTAKISP